MVRDQLKDILGEISEDVIVYTTIDSSLQKTAESLIKTAVAASGPPNRFDQGALVCIDVDGRVLAVVGGADFATSPYNIAINSRRQPGSTFKPFVYAAALEHGYTPDTMVDDAPFKLPDWSPENADQKFMGPISLRTALAQSRNTVAARLFGDLGADTIIEVARRVGISSPLNPWPSIVLGTSEISLMELTAGYVPFANGGYAAPARVIMRVETVKGREIFKSPEVHGRIFSAGVVAGMGDMLSTAIEVGTGNKARLPGWKSAGKT